MDLITLNRIKLMHPQVRQEVLEAYTHVNNKLLGKGVRLRFAYTLRTIQEQNEFYAQGRTKLFDKKGNRLGIVTNARGGQSIHNYGLAFDIVLLIDKNGDGNFETASWDIRHNVCYKFYHPDLIVRFVFFYFSVGISAYKQYCH